MDRVDTGKHSWLFSFASGFQAQRKRLVLGCLGLFKVEHSYLNWKIGQCGWKWVNWFSLSGQSAQFSCIWFAPEQIDLFNGLNHSKGHHDDQCKSSCTNSQEQEFSFLWKLTRRVHYSCKMSEPHHIFSELSSVVLWLGIFQQKILE